MHRFRSRFELQAAVLLLFLSGCNTSRPGGVIQDYGRPATDSCINEPDHHYLVSMPVIPPGEKRPLLIVLDPHGDGKLAVEIFSEALVDIPVIIAGSGKIRNNYPDFMSSLSHLVADVPTKYPADPNRVILAGFSGGARMAYYYGVNHRTLGIIMFGAGPDRTDRIPDGKRIYSVSGTRDFNFMEQYRPPFSILPPFSGRRSDADQGSDPEPYYVCDFFRGTHEWPPSELIHEAITWILKDDPNLPESVPEKISLGLLRDYDSLNASGEQFLAAMALQKAWIFSSKKHRNLVARTIAEFSGSTGWNESLENLEGYLKKEVRLKQAYAARLRDPDTSWWNREIKSMEQNIISCSDPVKEDFFYRIKGFIGIILYSQINSHIQGGKHTDVLDRLMLIYAMAEPDSPDLIKFREQVKQMK